MAAKSPKVNSKSTGATPPPASPVKTTKRRAKPAAARSGPTPIRVHYNVGLGNRITVRGDIDPFGWGRGVDARNTSADVWELHLEHVSAGQTFQFKPLINDSTYSTGDNYVGTGGQALDIYPAF